MTDGLVPFPSSRLLLPVTPQEQAARDAAWRRRDELKAMVAAGRASSDPLVRSIWTAADAQQDPAGYIEMMLARGIKDPRAKRRGRKPGGGRRQKQDPPFIKEAGDRIAAGEDRQGTLIDVASRMDGGTLDWRVERLEIALGYRKPRTARGSRN